MPNTKTGTTWAPDIRPGAIETFTEAYTPDGGREQAVEYKRVADHPILNGIRDIKAFFTTHVGAVWYNLAERKTLLAKLDEMDAEIASLKNTNNQLDTVDPTIATEVGFAADAKLTGDALREVSAKLVSFEQAKSTIINSALGKALGLAASTVLATVASKIASVVNRGAWTGTITTANGKITIPAGYHNGSGYVQASGLYVPPKTQNGSFTTAYLYAGSSANHTITFQTPFTTTPNIQVSVSKSVYNAPSIDPHITGSASVVSKSPGGCVIKVTSPRTSSGDTGSYANTVSWTATI